MDPAIRPSDISLNNGDIGHKTFEKPRKPGAGRPVAPDSVTTERALVDTVMDRHKRVQEQKRKGVWIEQDHPYWTLMPGYGDSSDAPRNHSGAYLHPFRVANAYSFLSDLGKVRAVEIPDGEEY